MEDPIEDLIAECLDRIPDEGEGVISTVCASHPEHEPAVRAALERLARAGLMVGSSSGSPAALPEQIGPFEPIRLLGAGGMGVVYLARQKGLRRLVALKVIRPEFALFPGARDRFVREITAVSTLQHPGVVPIYAADEEEGTPYYAMEWIPGLGLDALIKQLESQQPAQLTSDSVLAELDRAKPEESGSTSVGSSSPDDKLPSGAWWRVCSHWALRVAEALTHCHEHGVLHRDIKPSNILAGMSGRVAVIDFGLARPTDMSRVTQTGAVLGSRSYMSPEQRRGEWDTLDARSDVYSLGVTFAELLTLECPFNGEETQQQLDAPLGAWLRQRYAALPGDVAAVCGKALEFDPDRRYSSASDFAADLSSLLSGHPVRAQNPGIVQRFQRWVRRRPADATVIALLSLLIIVVATWGYGWSGQRRFDNHVEAAEELATTGSDLLTPDPTRVATVEAWIQRADEVTQQQGQHEHRATDPRFEELLTNLNQIESIRSALEEYSIPASLSMEPLLSDPLWEEARADIAADPRMGGLNLRPQKRMRPLRRDPSSGLWEFVHVLPWGNGHVDVETNGSYTITPDSGIIFVLVPGSADVRPFFLSKFELTTEQWFRAKHGRHWRNRNRSPTTTDVLLPAIGMSWLNARKAFTLLGIRLPTEVEWEHACRAGTATTHYAGDNAATVAGHEWVSDPSQTRAAPTRVGTLLPNPWGLHDLLGNVKEWCEDHASGLDRPDGLRVARGCSFAMKSEQVAITARKAWRFDRGSRTIGLRPARSIDEQ